MDECDFKCVRENTKKTLQPIAGGSEIAETELANCIDEVSTVYKKYYDKGLEPRQISHVLFETSLAMMFHSKDLGRTAQFSEFIRKSGDIACKSVAHHWPPIDRKNWPFDPKQWPAD